MVSWQQDYYSVRGMLVSPGLFLGNNSRMKITGRPVHSRFWHTSSHLPITTAAGPLPTRLSSCEISYMTAWQCGEKDERTGRKSISRHAGSCCHRQEGSGIYRSWTMPGIYGMSCWICLWHHGLRPPENRWRDRLSITPP